MENIPYEEQFTASKIWLEKWKRRHGVWQTENRLRNTISTNATRRIENV